jgi:cobaltochelatase CobN
VDDGKWQRMYDTYVEDRHGLKVRERFANAGNLRAFQAVIDRMLSAIERGYWKPSEAVRNKLAQMNAQAIKDAGVSCSADSCSKATLKVAPQFNADFVPNVGSNAAVVRGAATAARAGGAAPSPQAAMQNAAAELQALQAKAEAQPAPAAAATPPAPKQSPKPAPKPVAKPEGADKVSGFEMQTLSNLTPVQKTVGSLALLTLAAALVGVGYVGRRNKLRKLKGFL